MTLVVVRHHKVKVMTKRGQRGKEEEDSIKESTDVDDGKKWSKSMEQKE